MKIAKFIRIPSIYLSFCFGVSFKDTHVFLMIGLSLILFSVQNQSAAFAVFDESLHRDVTRVIRSARQGIEERALVNESQGWVHWDMPSYLGMNFVSQYLVFAHVSGGISQRFVSSRFLTMLFEDQLPDGGWQAVRDGAYRRSELSPSILNYIAAKALGVPVTDARMVRAREYILSQGGLMRGTAFVKATLALCGNMAWDAPGNVPLIPVDLLLSRASPIQMTQLAQWVGPHVIPLAYLRNANRIFRCQENYLVHELYSNPADAQRYVRTSSQGGSPRGLNAEFFRSIVGELLRRQKVHGSYGGYTLATQFSLIVLNDAMGFWPEITRSVEVIRSRANRFLDRMYFQSGESAYLGVLDDGHYWDSVLIGLALHDSGGHSLLPGVRTYLGSRQSLRAESSYPGGWGFGNDFEDYPDADDTAEILMLLTSDGFWSARVSRGIEFLLTMQNSDGGWGAFDRNNIENSLITQFAGPLRDSADLFDDSSVDVTAHIVESLSVLRRRGAELRENGPEFSVRLNRAIASGVSYLLRNQEQDGAWVGRWGINTIYATGAALVALERAGMGREHAQIQLGASYLISKQTANGGFGESFQSYSRAEFRGRGEVTPTQTAWAMMGLMAAGMTRSAEVDRAARALVVLFDHSGRVNAWVDRSGVGTGHPGLLAMQYPSYAFAFPLQALGRYLELAQ